MAEKLQQTMAHTQHEFSNGKSITVGMVRVIPQPLGAFFEYSIQNLKYEQMKKQQNLIIDSGFFTFDWLLCAGQSTNDKRSGSVNHGMSSVLMSIAEAIKKGEKLDSDTTALASVGG